MHPGYCGRIWPLGVHRQSEELDDRYQDRPLVCYYPGFNLTQCEEIEKIGEASIGE